MNEQTATVAELNPCPFCGEKPDIIRVSEHSFFAECKGDKCRAVIFTHGHTPEQAAKKWNSRTEQPQEQKHGRWIDRYFGDKCSECGFEISRTNSVFKSAFCPKCGAKMDAANNLNPLNLPIESGENAADDQDGRWPKRNPYINGGETDAG